MNKTVQARFKPIYSGYNSLAGHVECMGEERGGV